MLGTFISGRYSSTYNSVDLGITRQGYELEVIPKAEVLDESDAYGLTTIDWVIRGADAFMQFESREYKAGPVAAFWPNGLGLGQLLTASLPIGRFASDASKALVLTSTASTPAASSPATLTATQTLLAPNYNPKILFDSRIRNVPIRLQLLPYTSSPSSTLVFFSTT